ncbi:dihydroorotate dehydrogenase (quinone), partial [Corynebacterium amycolatum]|nr:dihydroorotate dehydrogenase (quinone) [Corynebacterium amycolatum]
MPSKLRAKSYQLALKAMFQVPPEQIHEAISKTLKGLQKSESLQRAVSKLLVVDDAVLRQTVFGVDFPRPLGLAAGFDKAAIAPDCWG